MFPLIFGLWNHEKTPRTHPTPIRPLLSIFVDFFYANLFCLCSLLLFDLSNIYFMYLICVGSMFDYWLSSRILKCSKVLKAEASGACFKGKWKRFKGLVKSTYIYCLLIVIFNLIVDNTQSHV
jgi:hypothetical protein